MSKILFLNPPHSLSDLYNELGEAGSELPPLGVAILAAVTRQEGYETKILDALALRLSMSETVKRIIAEKPDYLGITSTTMSIYSAAEVAKRVKEANPSIKVILGGPHITAAPEETMKLFPEFEIGVMGEAEETIVELLKFLDSGKKEGLENVNGLLIRKKSEIKFTGKRQPIMNLDRLPFPAWNLLPDLVKYYQPAADSLNRGPATLLITSRGCTGQCIFCDRSVFGNLCRCYSADYVIRMIRYLQENYGIRELFIEDDNFILFKTRLKQICERIINEKIDITWSCLGRVDTIDPELLKLMKKAGCWQINFGCESGSQKILDTLKKGVKVEQIEKAVMMARKAGIDVKGLFMLGNFGETEETVKETLKFIKKIPLTDFHITCFTPLPGAEAYDTANKYGTFDKDWKKTNMFNAENFTPFGLTKEQLEKYYKKAWRTFYFQPRIIARYTLKLKNRHVRKKIITAGLAFLKFLSAPKKIRAKQWKETQWEKHWNSLNKESSTFGRFCSFYRTRVIANAVSHYLERYFPEEGFFAECGSGTSQTSVKLDKKSRKIAAVDISMQALHQASKIRQNDACIKASVFSMPFKDSSLDGLWNLGVMEHFTSEEIDAALLEFNRVLKKGSSAVLFWPPKYGPVAFGIFFTENFSKHILRKQLELFPDEVSRLSSEIKIKEKAKKAGFSDLKIHYSPRDLFTHKIVVLKK